MEANLIYEGNRNIYFEDAIKALAETYKGSLGLFSFSNGQFMADLYFPDNVKDNFISDAKILVSRFNIKLNILGTWYLP